MCTCNFVWFVKSLSFFHFYVCYSMQEFVYTCLYVCGHTYMCEHVESQVGIVNYLILFYIIH